MNPSITYQPITSRPTVIPTRVYRLSLELEAQSPRLVAYKYLAPSVTAMKSPFVALDEIEQRRVFTPGCWSDLCS